MRAESTTMVRSLVFKKFTTFRPDIRRDVRRAVFDLVAGRFIVIT
jgi:hypothetical protein